VALLNPCRHIPRAVLATALISLIAGCLVPPPPNSFYSRQKNTPSIYSPEADDRLRAIEPARGLDLSPTLSPPRAPQGWNPEVIAVWPLDARAGMPAELVAALSDTIRAQILASGIFRLVSMEETGKLAKQIDWQANCSDLSCAAELGRQLTVRQIIVGSAARIENNNQIVLKLVDVETAEMLACGQAIGRDGQTQLVDTVKESANSLLQQVLQASKRPGPGRP
jgi:hypothetical protein